MSDKLPAGTKDLLSELAAMAHFTIGQRASYDWPSIESALGVPLPSQYKALVECFPPGVFRLLHVFHPAMSEPPWPRRYGLVEAVKEQSSGLHPWDESKPSRYQTYPQPGGLIAWAADRDYYLAWLPDGDDPDRWPVIAYEMDGDGDGELVEGSTLQALIRVLRGDAGRRVFPNWFWDEPLDFLAGDPANG